MKTLALISVVAIMLAGLIYPVSVDGRGPSAASSGGNFPGGLQYYIASTIDYGPGSLTITFPRDCKNLVIQTGQFWPNATQVKVVFYNGRHQEGHVTQPLAAFSEVGVNFRQKFDKIVIVNTSPAGMYDDSTLTISGAYCHR
jgi:hypothetical protein